jgi:hypothetical protein
MRRTAAVAVFLLCVPALAKAASAPQLVLQLGASGRASRGLSEPTMNLECVYKPFSMGGGWLEFGVLGRAGFEPRTPLGPPNPPSTTIATRTPSLSGSQQILEVSTGIVLGPPRSASLFPYIKGGIGAYRDVDFVAVPVSPADDYPRYDERTRWDIGMSFGPGVRMGPPGGTSPMIEGRYHLTRLDGNDFHQLFSVSGGVWFR